MCRESIHFNHLIRKKLNVLANQTGPKAHKNCDHHQSQTHEHHGHDDAEEKAYRSHEKSDPNIRHPHEHSEHNHQHDDVISLAHRHHDHQYPIHLMQGAAGFRQHSCHAGDGHDHGGGSQTMGSAIPLIPRISLGGDHHHHEEGEHEHCPHCDEHLVEEKCPKCGYKHEH